MRNASDTGVRKKRLLLLAVFLLVTLSLCRLSYVIGRIGTGSSYAGRIVDAIILSPASGSSQIYQVDIAGVVLNADGTPYQNGTIELRSEARYTTTDENGRFEFDNVPEGEHTISVLQNGIVLATCTITIEKVSFVASQKIIQFGDNSFRIMIPLEAVVINLRLELTDGRLTFAEDTVTAPQINVSDDIIPSQIWMQATSVDIFAERPGNNGITTIDGTNVIAPGSNGKYIFKIENPEAFPVEYTISLLEADENNPGLPMKYRLRQGVSGNNYIGGNDWKIAEDILAAAASLAAGGDSYYTLEWKWDTADDATDTAIGMQDGDPVYILDIVISAQF